MEDHFTVTCPYCGEEVEVYLEPDVGGSFVQDCEVCCNPWLVRVVRDGEDEYVDVSRADGSWRPSGRPLTDVASSSAASSAS